MINFHIQDFPDDWSVNLSIDALIAMYQQAFTDSSDADEGAMIANLMRQIITDNTYICHVAVEDDNEILGAVCWTPITLQNHAISAYLMSPVAVKTTHQNLKIGQQLIQHGLKNLASHGMDLVLSYGDPNYYQKVGFKPLDVKKITPPYPLSMPFGWIGQSLTKMDIDDIHISEPPICVPAFCHANLW